MNFKKTLGISFAPNVEKDDALLSLSLLVKNNSEKNTVIKLENWFKTYQKSKYAYTFSSGRAALYNILEAYELPRNSGVLIQAFTCIAVPNAIRWVGHLPQYVDIDSTYNMDAVDFEKKITENTKIVIIQHTFGIPANIEKIAAIAKKNNLILIEDCAHALGSEYEGRLVGSYGDCAFFSFGRDKAISCVFGGVVTTNNHELAQKIKTKQTQLESSTLIFVVQQLLYAPLYYFALFFYPFYIGKLFLRFLFWSKILIKAVTREERIGNRPDFINFSLHPKLATLALHQCKKLDRYNTHRRNIAEIYSEKLKKLSIKINTNPIFLRYPFLSSKRNEIKEQCKKQGVHLGDWYGQPVVPVGDYDITLYKKGSCPRAEHASSHIVNLPTSIHITKHIAQSICTIITSIENN